MQAHRTTVHAPWAMYDVNARRDLVFLWEPQPPSADSTLPRVYKGEGTR